MTGDPTPRSNSTNISSTTTAAKNPETKMTTASLGGFLDTPNDATTTKTVADESAETEIYIRSDGKKVRRVMKKVVRTISAASTVAEGDTESKLKNFMKKNSNNGAKIPKSAMSVDGAGIGGNNRSNTFSEGEVYINKDGKKVRRVKRTVSSASTAAAPSSAAGNLSSLLEKGSPSNRKMGSSATVAGGTGVEGEIYINKDGKKVRRVKRTVSSASVAAAPSSAPGNLFGLLEKGSPSNRKMGSSATVTGDAGMEGEIYINKDGKKVRRVRRTVSKSTISGATTAATATASKPMSGAASVVGEGEIYINKDGKKVRRVKRSESKSATASTTTDSLGGFLGKSTPPTTKSNKLSSDSSLSSFLGKSKSKKKKGSSNNSLSSFLSKSKSKKKKGSSNSSLGSFLGKSSSKSKRASGSATVAGSTPTKNKSLEQVGETYINKDGKKVRHVKKSKAGSATVTGDVGGTTTASSSLSTTNKTASLSGLLGSHKPTAKGSAATVAGDRVAKPQDEEGEIYIRPDGKKVRRIRKTKSPSGAASVDGSGGGSSQVDEIYINKDGKKVRRIIKTRTEDSLGGFLSNNNAISGPRAGSGSATVAGSTPSKSNTFSEGEIYVRPDGKKVRRVRKSTNNASLSVATTSAAGDLASSSSGPGEKKTPLHRDAATVAGERVIKQVPEGEIIIRADGKKVLRRRKTPSVGSGGSKSLESEVYRRADGKLVRRVKRTASTQSTQATPTTKTLPGDLAGYMENKANAGKQNKHACETATVVGEGPAPSISDLLKSKQASSNTATTGESSSTTPPPAAAPLSAQSTRQKENVPSLTDAEEEIAGQYRRLKGMGMPDEAVQHRMTVDGVASNIVAAVLGTSVETQAKPVEEKELEEKAPQPTPATSNITTSSGIQLSDDEETIATSYKKMKRMGLPDDAIKHKMGQDGVDPKIIAYVLGEPWNDGSSAQSSPTFPTAAAVVSPPTPAPPLVHPPAPAPTVVSPPVPALAVVSPPATPAPAVAPSPAPAPAVVPSPAPVPTTSSIQLSADQEAIASSYAKMKRMGLPDDAVKHKMNQDEVDPKIVAYVLGEPWNDSSLIQSPTPVPPPVAVSPHALAPVPAPDASSIQLSSDEEAVAYLYTKMKKMGMPDDAVKHKMSQDGVDPKIIAFVLGEAWNDDSSVPSSSAPAPALDAVSALGAASVPTSVPAPVPVPAPTTSSIQLSPDEETLASSYTKMKKMGLPDDAVKHKMTQDGIDPKIMAFVIGEAWNDDSLVPSSPAPAPTQTSASPPFPAPVPAPAALSIQLSADEETLASSYTKMKKMGLPDDAVKHKMTQDGIDPKIMAFVLGEPWSDDLSAPSPSSAPAPASAPAASSIQLSPGEETVASSYTKMKKMGLPDAAVKHKMTQDGVDRKIMAFVLGEPWNDDSPAEQTASVDVPFPEPIAPVIQLTEEEEAVASQYRKMLAMGLPKDAVRHKLQQDGISGKICAAVLEEPWKDPGTATEKKASFNLVMSEDESAKNEKPSSLAAALSGRPALKRQNSSETVATVHPHEKFAVKLDNAGNEGVDRTAEVETKYMTLDDIARLSGQSRDDLEKMIVDRRNNDQQIPRFVLQPLEESKKPVAVPLFPVQISKGEPPAAAAPAEQAPNPVVANPALASADPNHLKEVKDGEEVVDSALANAARAVAALGENDMSSLLAKLQAGDMGRLLEKLQEAEKRQKKLEKQLAQAGVAIAEDIDYTEARTQVEKIAKRMNEIGGSDIVLPDKEEQNRLREEYFKLEQQMERYNTALMLTEEYQAEQDKLERQWEEDNAPANLEALKKIRRHMPVKIRHMSEAELTNTPSPNGKFLPKAIAKKFKRTNVLQMLRLNPDDIERMHPSTLESMRVTGLTLTERRALYLHLKPIGPKWEKNKAEKMTERKWTWYKMMKSNFKENLAPYLRHVAEYGPPENHPYATRDNPNGGCPLIGKQCPIKADKLIDYDGDYGWTEEAEYEVSQVTKADADDPGAKAMQEALELAREKKANERADLLKKHYKGKLLQVSKANGSCEAMDETMDKAEFATMRWIEYIIEKGENESDADKKKEVANFNTSINELKLSVLDFCQRSGMQISGKKKAGGDGADIRSAVECGLAEEVYECTQELFEFIRSRMKDINQRDTRVEKTIELLEGMLGELHNKNLATLQKLGVKRPDRSRKLRRNEDIRKEVEDKMKPKEEDTPAAEEKAAPVGPPGGGGGRGGLMAAISGRGRGRGGGRGDLMAAISGRGRGRGGGRGGGRGDLLAAISGRGGGGDAAGGRGGLLAAIQARGDGGRGGGGDAGGRGGLLAAVQARGGGD